MRTVGAILGTQVGKVVSIHTSFPVPWVATSQRPDWGYLTEKFTRQKAVHESYEVLGWYSAGSCDLKTDILIHEELIRLDLNEASPLYLTIDVGETGSGADELPIRIFQSIGRQQSGEALGLTFHPASFVLETEESERVAVDEIAKSGHSAPTEGPSVVPHMQTVGESIQHMTARVLLITKFLEQVKSGALPYDHAILRRINALAATLPSSESPEFRSAFISELNDSLLVTLMAISTRGFAAFDSASLKFRALTADSLPAGASEKIRKMAFGRPPTGGPSQRKRAGKKHL